MEESLKKISLKFCHKYANLIKNTTETEFHQRRKTIYKDLNIICKIWLEAQVFATIESKNAETLNKI